MQGGCLCRSVRYEVDGEPESAGICHCETCRRTASAPALPFAVVPAANFRITAGELKSYRSSEKVTRTFCGQCGSPLTYRSDDSPDTIDLMFCSLDDPNQVRPARHIWLQDRLAWDQCPDGLPRLLRSSAENARSDG